MNAEKLETMQEILRASGGDQSSRREILGRLAGTASAGVISYLFTGKLRPVFGQSVAGDLGILTAALYLEH